MRVLITGTTGFIGKYMDLLFRGRGDQVWRLVRKPTGAANEIIWDFISPLPEIPEVDVFIHLAGVVNFNERFDAEQYAVNTMATYQLVRLAALRGTFFIFSSSMAGIHGSEGILTTASPLAPIGHYGISKYLAEELIRASAGRWIIVRLGGIYGLDGPAHLGLNRSITNAYYRRQPPVLKGSGRAKRNYLLVSDTVRWIAAIVDDPGPHIGKTIGLSGSENLSLREYLANIAEILADGAPLVEQNGPDGQDMIFEGEQAPFALTSFKEYLKQLGQARKL